MSTAVLYTPEVLGLAVQLAGHPWDEALSLKAEARSQSCGSTIALGLDLDAEGRIVHVGVRSQACAIGQAAAAIFSDAAIGRTSAQVHDAAAKITRWLAGEEGLPDWPGFVLIAAARDYPARHGAVMLPWKAATQVLPIG
ncbi:iron-sulfur cluster assembly scaffold protein [Novosphingobium aerophilum]|uniref:iron-sulfur cluster assembly scaffold protein n=1 Tax=Novosphingobium TaxID=165696 RepID=UPI002D77393A|nr:iron-sulfur cluster assembly scaffold protein [Novosphingobium sp. RL4]WRT91688.1 iron-sulfur cluster assembly scaffold protein [Novosphingobium sp. RL4]